MKFTRTSFQHGSVRKVPRSSGSFAWEFRYRVTENGARKMKQTTLDGRKYPSEAAAKKKLASLTLGLNTGTQQFNPTLDAVLDLYLDSEMPERPKSVVNYKLLIGHIRPVWGSLLLTDILPHAVESWIRGLKYSTETKRHIRNMMYRVFEFAMKRGLLEIQRNPISLIRVKGSKRTKELVVLTPQQVGKILARLSGHVRLMAQLGCFLGLRISEVLGLQWQDIDWEKGALSIRRSAVDGNVGETKTVASNDSVPLSAEMLALLRNWQSDTRPNLDGWLFANPVTGKPYHAGILLRRHLHTAAKDLEIPRFGWHTFRHTFRSWLDAVGTPVGVQQRMMRHADISTTMNVYGSALMESKRDAQSKLLNFAGVGLCGVETGGTAVSA